MLCLTGLLADGGQERALDLRMFERRLDTRSSGSDPTRRPHTTAHSGVRATCSTEARTPRLQLPARPVSTPRAAPHTPSSSPRPEVLTEPEAVAPIRGCSARAPTGIRQP